MENRCQLIITDVMFHVNVSPPTNHCDSWYENIFFFYDTAVSVCFILTPLLIDLHVFIIAFFNCTKIPIFGLLDTICVQHCKHQSNSYIYHQKILGWSRCYKTSSYLPQAIGNLLFLNVSSNDITQQFCLCV